MFHICDLFGDFLSSIPPSPLLNPKVLPSGEKTYVPLPPASTISKSNPSCSQRPCPRTSKKKSELEIVQTPTTTTNSVLWSGFRRRQKERATTRVFPLFLCSVHTIRVIHLELLNFYLIISNARMKLLGWTRDQRIMDLRKKFLTKFHFPNFRSMWDGHWSNLSFIWWTPRKMSFIHWIGNLQCC